MPHLVPWLVLCLWAVTAVVATALRPGELLEFGLVGLAGLCAWPLIRGGANRRLQVTAALVFFVPLLNTWPARSLSAQIEGIGVVSYLLSPSSLLGLLIVAVAPWQRVRRVAVLPLAVAALIVAAAVVSTVASLDRPAAAASSWLGLILPLGVAAAIAGAANTTRDRWTLLIASGLAALVPAAMGVTAWVISFGMPSSFDDVLAAKVLLYRTGLVQEVTFGNVSHLAAFGLLMAPAALMATLAASLPSSTRVGAGVSAILVVTAALAVFSRAAILIFATVLAVSAVLVASHLWHSRRAEGVMGAALLGATAVVFATLGGSSLSPEATLPTGGVPVETVDGSPVRPAPPSSVEFRKDAIRAGFRLSGEHPLGVGSGQYAAYDPVHRSPHSLLIRVLVENGLLGGAAFVALLAAFCLAIMRFARAPDATEEWLLRAGCALGTGGFLLFGLVAGAPLALGTVAVWSLLLAIQVGILFSRPEAQSR